MNAGPPAKRGVPDRSTHEQIRASSLRQCHTPFLQTMSAEPALVAPAACQLSLSGSLYPAHDVSWKEFSLPVPDASARLPDKADHLSRKRRHGWMNVTFSRR